MARDAAAGPRRAPDPHERVRDAERTRRALLDAALAEFAEKGRAGARVSEIAARAGVNKQLISYYFGGKDGLYAAIVERWHAQEADWSAERLDLEELVTRYLRAAVGQRDLQRFFLRELLDGDVASQPAGPDGGVPPDLADLRRRQAEGELAADVDPALALLLFQAAVSAGVLFAEDVRAMAGVDPFSEAFLERYGALLRRVVRGLAEPPPPE
ncbi:MAG TPA: TetR family transcriptional regulator [Solirubrobacteraceae bacterium]